MADKVDLEVNAFKHVDLERKNHHQPVDGFGHLRNTPAVPCPDLRADVVEHFDAALFQLAGKAQVETGIVHQQSGVRPALIRLDQHFIKGALKKRVALEHFDNTKHIHFAGVVQQFHAFGAEFVAADSPNGQIRTFLLQRTDDIRRVHVAGIFACYNQK